MYRLSPCTNCWDFVYASRVFVECGVVEYLFPFLLMFVSDILEISVYKALILSKMLALGGFCLNFEVRVVSPNGA
mgnify:CR=1 FL=1